MSRLPAGLIADDPQRPEWIKINSVSRHVEIGKKTLYSWIAKGILKSRLVRSPGCIKGTRLIHLPTLFAIVENSESTLTKHEKYAK